MTSRDFCFWLQGVFEVGKPTSLDAEQIHLIQMHLGLVFKHEIDPEIDAQHPDMKTALDQLHSGVGPGSAIMRC